MKLKLINDVFKTVHDVSSFFEEIKLVLVYFEITLIDSVLTLESYHLGASLG